MPRSLNGGVTLEYRPDGWCCTLDLAASDVVFKENMPYRAVLNCVQ
jgi:hypothetical protein